MNDPAEVRADALASDLQALREAWMHRLQLRREADAETAKIAALLRKARAQWHEWGPRTWGDEPTAQPRTVPLTEWTWARWVEEDFLDYNGHPATRKWAEKIISQLTFLEERPAVIAAHEHDRLTRLENPRLRGSYDSTWSSYVYAKDLAESAKWVAEEKARGLGEEEAERAVDARIVEAARTCSANHLRDLAREARGGEFPKAEGLVQFGGLVPTFVADEFERAARWLLTLDEIRPETASFTQKLERVVGLVNDAHEKAQRGGVE